MPQERHVAFYGVAHDVLYRLEGKYVELVLGVLHCLDTKVTGKVVDGGYLFVQSIHVQSDRLHGLLEVSNIFLHGAYKMDTCSSPNRYILTPT